MAGPYVGEGRVREVPPGITGVDLAGSKRRRKIFPRQISVARWDSMAGRWYVPSDGGCLIWIGAKTNDGYAYISGDKRTTYAHRLAYLLQCGPIPKSLCIDHLCRVRHCVNVDHMELVLPVTNVMRGVSRAAQNLNKTHCIRGHELVPPNIRLYDNGYRHCLTCAKVRDAERRARVKQHLALGKT